MALHRAARKGQEKAWVWEACSESHKDPVVMGF